MTRILEQEDCEECGEPLDLVDLMYYDEAPPSDPRLCESCMEDIGVDGLLEEEYE